MTQVFRQVTAIKNFRQQAWQQNKTIGFVPTMGNLHAGHVSLLKQAKNQNDLCVLSLFINPTQFNNKKDLANYPKTLKSDYQIAQANGVDVIFTPQYQTLYPDNYRFRVCETELSQQLEGQHRPGHFDGVLSVVMKLLQIVKPERAYFGMKDFQQYQLVQEMCQAFFLETKIIGCPTIRDSAGLALSSRNNLLSSKARQHAANLHHALISGSDCTAIKAQLQQLQFEVDYVEEYGNRRFVAASLEGVRLIDNVQLEEATPPC